MIDIKINTIVNRFFQKILNDENRIKELSIKNIVPSYNKILIQFDPLISNKAKIINYIKSIKINEDKTNKKKIIIEVPICYDNFYSLDLEEISRISNIPKKEIIKKHLDTLFHVYMIGFIPGLPFMGDMDNASLIPRKNTPRIKVPSGSVV